MAKSIVLNGSSQYFTVADNAALDFTGDFTIETWFKPDQTPDLHDAIISKRFNDTPGTNTGNPYEIYINTSDRIGSINNASGGSRSVSGGGDVVDGNWHHVVLRVLSNELEVFVDGVSIGTDNDPSTNTITNNVPVYVGVRGTSSGPQANTYFDGKLFDLRIWNIARTDKQIAEFKEYLVPNDEEGLVANYLFHDNVNSETGSHNGSAVNNPTYDENDLPHSNRYKPKLSASMFLTF